MSVHTVSINGLNLVYEKDGSGPPLVFLPGGNASIVCFEAIVPHFLGEYTCYRLDQRGHGRSGRPDPPQYHIDDFVSDAEQFLQSVSGPAVIVGWSLGAVVAFGLAARRPDLVLGIFSEDAIPQVVTSADVPTVVAFLSQLGDLARRREAENLSVVQHAYNVGQLTTQDVKTIDLWPPALLHHFARFTEGTDPAFYDRLGEPDLTVVEAQELCRNVRCPVHIAVANPQLGGVISAEAFQLLDQTGMAYTRSDYPRSGHTLNFAFPREFITDLRAFLARL
jgi:pimeloyl-ACP methyl ester carboxylesterase